MLFARCRAWRLSTPSESLWSNSISGNVNDPYCSSQSLLYVSAFLPILIRLYYSVPQRAIPNTNDSISSTEVTNLTKNDLIPPCSNHWQHLHVPERSMRFRIMLTLRDPFWDICVWFNAQGNDCRGPSRRIPTSVRMNLLLALKLENCMTISQRHFETKLTPF